MAIFNWNAIFLGTAADIDTDETSVAAENPNALLGTYGSVGNPLYQQVKPVTVNDADNDTNINTNNTNFASPEPITVDGVTKTVDSGVVYNATITYTDGTTANITAVVMQMTDGSLYLAPEMSQNADFTAMEAKPIRALTLNSTAANPTNVAANRQQTDFMACFVNGTRIATPRGPRAIETLNLGDLVITADHGPQPIRWISRRRIGVTAQVTNPSRRPVEIAAGALGQGLPTRPLRVSQLHAMAIRSAIAERMTGQAEVLLRANRLCTAPGIVTTAQFRPLELLHLQFDRHEIIFAEGAPSESLQASTAARLKDGCPDEPTSLPEEATARLILQGARAARLVARHRKNAQPFLAEPPGARKLTA